jgi:type I site-specific restriction endonuclease
VSDLKELIFQAVGQSSMCWDPIPTGVFDSTQAEKIGYEVFAKFEKLQRENQILRDACQKIITTLSPRYSQVDVASEALKAANAVRENK